jgi:drug/metabolite transporter (DMT)-like permease
MPDNNISIAKINRGYGFAVVSALFLSTTAIFIRHLTQTYEVPALVLAFWRDGFVTLTLFPLFLIIKPGLLKINRVYIKYLLAYGFVLAIFNAFWTLSVSLNGAAISTVLVYSSAAFTAILGWRLLQENLNRVKILAITLSLAGCVLVSGAYTSQAWQSNFLGILTGIFSGLLYAIYSLMGRTASNKGLNPWTTLFYTFGFAAVFLFIANIIPGDFLPGKASLPGDFMWLGNAFDGWLVLFLLAAIPTVAGFGFYNVSLSYLPSSIANLIATLEPAFTAFSAYILLGEKLTLIQIFGSLVTLTGVVFLRIFEDYKRKRLTYSTLEAD